MKAILQLVPHRRCRVVGLTALTALALSSFACREDLPPPRDEPRTDRLRITVIAESRNDPEYTVLQRAGDWFVQQYSKASLRVVAPPAASAVAQQQLLDSLARSADVDAVIVLPTDPTFLTGSVASMVQSGKAVFLLGRDIPNGTRTAFIGPTEGDIGMAAAEAATAELKDGLHSIMVLHAGDEHLIYGRRLAALRNHLPVAGDAKLLREVDCKGNRVDAVELVRRESRLFPRAGCWIFLDDWPLRALGPGERLVPDACSIVLCNPSPAYFEYMQRGEIQALVMYDFRKGAEEAFVAALQWSSNKRGETTPDVRLPPVIVNRHNLAEWYNRWQRWQQAEPQAMSATQPAGS